MLVSVIGAAGTTALVATIGANNALSNPFLAATVACGVVGGQFGANTGIFVSVTPLHGSLGCAPCGPLHTEVAVLFCIC